jgi:Fe-Mn family superoxide dismutase
MYQLPSLPYDAGALAPVIGVDTMRTHHGKHHARYVSVTNELVRGTPPRPLEDVIADARVRGDAKLFNNAAQAWNHAFFWLSMAPVATTPSGDVLSAIEVSFGSVATLREKLVATGAAHFGSGWVWLVACADKLELRGGHDADQPWHASERELPLLVCDVWEHAYYLDYKNERDRFLGAWFDRLANWDFAAAQWEAAKGGGRPFRYPLPA